MKQLHLRIFNLMGIVLATNEEKIAELEKHKERFELLRDEASAAIDEIENEIDITDRGNEDWSDEYIALGVALGIIEKEE